MDLIIQIRDGQPYEHPIMLDNFMSAFPTIDIYNLPPTFAYFERVPMPKAGPYEEIIGVSYQWVGNIVKDVWEIRSFTEQEKIEKQNYIKSYFVSELPEIQSWIFDEERCGFRSPIPYPNDNQLYFWKEDTQEWLLYADSASTLTDPTNTNFIPPISFIVGVDFITF